MRAAEAPTYAPGQVVSIVYTNYRGDTETRRILPRRIWFGETSWHQGRQWILEAYDFDRHADRSFALKDVLEVEPVDEGVDVVSDRRGAAPAAR